MSWSKTGRNVGGRGHDQRTFAPVEVGERRAVEEYLVIQVGRQFRAAPTRRRQIAPVQRIESAGDDCALHIALEETLLIVGEQLVTIETVGQRREAAAGYPGNHPDAIQKPGLFAIRPDNLGAPEKLEDAVREGSRPRAASGKRQDDQCLVVLEMGLPGRQTVAAMRVGLRDRRIHRPSRATTENEHGGENHGQQHL
jgi:hypothetical protein